MPHSAEVTKMSSSEDELDIENLAVKRVRRTWNWTHIRTFASKKELSDFLNDDWSKSYTVTVY